MNRTLVLALLAALSAVPAQAQNSYWELPPEGRNIVDALEAQEYWGNPNDWKAWTVTMIWVIQNYGLPVDTQGLEWESYWHMLIRVEQGQIDTSMVDDYGAPDRAGRCAELNELKRKYNIGAGVLAHNAAVWGLWGHWIAPTNPFLANVKWRVEFIAGLSALFSAQLAGIGAMLPECATAE